MEVRPNYPQVSLTIPKATQPLLMLNYRDPSVSVTLCEKDKLYQSLLQSVNARYTGNQLNSIGNVLNGNVFNDTASKQKLAELAKTNPAIGKLITDTSTLATKLDETNLTELQARKLILIQMINQQNYEILKNIDQAPMNDFFNKLAIETQAKVEKQRLRGLGIPDARAGNAASDFFDINIDTLTKLNKIVKTENKIPDAKNVIANNPEAVVDAVNDSSDSTIINLSDMSEQKYDSIVEDALDNIIKIDDLNEIVEVDIWPDDKDVIETNKHITKILNTANVQETIKLIAKQIQDAGDFGTRKIIGMTNNETDLKKEIKLATIKDSDQIKAITAEHSEELTPINLATLERLVHLNKVIIKHYDRIVKDFGGVWGEYDNYTEIVRAYGEKLINDEEYEEKLTRFKIDANFVKKSYIRAQEGYIERLNKQRADAKKKLQNPIPNQQSKKLSNSAKRAKKSKAEKAAGKAAAEKAAEKAAAEKAAAEKAAAEKAAAEKTKGPKPTKNARADYVRKDGDKFGSKKKEADPNKGFGLMLYKNKDELLRKLKILIGERKSGNNNKELKNDIANIASELKKTGVIKMTAFKEIYTKYVL